MQTLLTGFGAFGTVVSNPAERLVNYFATETVPGHQITVFLLPVAYARAAELLPALLEIGGICGKPFDNILMLGVAGGRNYWSVERYGRNRDKATIPDTDGVDSSERPIVPAGPDMLSATLPVESIAAAIEKTGLRAVPSEDAGGYLCNHALYRLLHLLKADGSVTRAGFLHVPPDTETFAPGITLSTLVTWEQEIAAVRAALGALASE